MKREHDAIEEALIHHAASKALVKINELENVTSVTRFVRSGDTMFRVQLSVVDKARLPRDFTKAKDCA